MNVLLDGVTSEWNGYTVNTDYRNVIRITQAIEDETLLPEERFEIIMLLLFQNDDGTVRDYPEPQGIKDIVEWLLTGWNHDNTPKNGSKQRLIDYDVDQWRIYADFRQIYGIDLTVTRMHYWMFQGLLWSMPAKQSSFLQIIEIRTKKPRKNATKEEREAIAKAKEVYGLKQPEEPKAYSQEEIDKIDAFDAMMRKHKDGRRQDHN